MYYHCRELKYVLYDKVYPAPIDKVDNFLLPAYKWLGQYCGYCPQIWLSRSVSQLTGYKNANYSSKSKKRDDGTYSVKRNIEFEDKVMFGFDIIKGFPVDYYIWCYFLNHFSEDGHSEDYITRDLNEWAQEGNLKPVIQAYPIIQQWLNSDRKFDVFIRKYLFSEKDQVVVPSLNLKSAKKVICHNEKQRKTLRKMGFIEDRIEVRNLKWKIL